MIWIIDHQDKILNEEKKQHAKQCVQYVIICVKGKERTHSRYLLIYEKNISWALMHLVIVLPQGIPCTLCKSAADSCQTRLLPSPAPRPQAP